MKSILRLLLPNLRTVWRSLRHRRFLIDLDYPIAPQPRWGHGQTPHPLLYALVDRRRERYRELLHRFLDSAEFLQRIPRLSDADSSSPFWCNSYLPALDAVALYNMLVIHRPARYLEIGSGNSTRFARRAITDHGLRTKLVSIDPQPRAEVAGICDQVFRHGLERNDLSIFSTVQPGDFVFFDGTHRVFTNSDVTVFFLDILPRLPAGTFVHIHDIWLPSDYPNWWSPHYYSEQYLLAAWLLAAPDSLEILLPSRFVVDDPELSAILDPMWTRLQLSGVQTWGGSFWVRTLSGSPRQAHNLSASSSA